MKHILLAVALVGILATGCTENIRSKTFGGNMNVTLPQGQKLVTATWKNAELWYLTRPMQTNEVAETFTFVEKSSFGLVEGKVTFVESK